MADKGAHYARRIGLYPGTFDPIANGHLDVIGRNGMVIEVIPFDTLLIDFARKLGASMIVRGLRAVSDFDYEFQMAGMNYRMAPDIETVFLMASERHQFIASRLVKEVAMLGGDITSFVPPLTHERILKRIRG